MWSCFINIFADVIKICRCFMKKILALVKQYLIELILELMFLGCIIFDSFQGKNILASIIYNFIMTCSIYFFLIYIAMPVIFFLTSKKKGKLLQLTWWNEICMMPKKVNNVHNFIEDMNDILKYAKKREYK